jgi:hypothetical protein
MPKRIEGSEQFLARPERGTGRIIVITVSEQFDKKGLFLSQSITRFLRGPEMPWFAPSQMPEANATG